MEEYQEIKGTTAIFFQLAYSSTTFRNENGTSKKYAFGSDLLELIFINENDKDAYSMGFENGKKKTHTYIHTYVFFSMTEKGASGNESGKKTTFLHFFFLELFSQIFPNQVKFRSF